MFVSRKRAQHLEWEAQEWRRRAEIAAAKPAVVVPVKVRTSLWVRAMSASWLIVIGLLVGGVAVPHANDRPTLEPDYGSCVSSRFAKSAYYPQATQYQKLVNALWDCEVFHK